MKRIKRILVIALASALILVPITSFATTIKGNSIVEHDNSTDPKGVFEVMLPTIAEDTYNFTLDHNGLLNAYNPAVFGNAGDKILFATESVPASLTHKAGVSGLDAASDLFKITYAVDGSFADIKAAITMNSGSVASINPANAYFVWVPQKVTVGTSTVRTGEGEFVRLTAANIGNYFNITEDASNAGDVDAFAAINTNKTEVGGTPVFDGNVYIRTVDPFTDAVDYITVTKNNTAWVITGTTAPIYVLNATGEYITVEDAIESVAALTKYEDIMEYTPAVGGTWATSSNSATITNRSTVPIAVDVELKVVDDGALTFSGTDDFTGGDATAMVYFALEDGAAVQELVARANVADKFAKAANTFNLGDSGTTAGFTYQAANEEADVTGGHNYYTYRNYVNPYSGNSSVFFISANANKVAGNETDWEDYVEALIAEDVEMPEIELVYTLKTANPFGPVAATLKNGAANYTSFPSPTVAVTLTVDGIPTTATINKVSVGGFELTAGAGQHYTTTGNTISIIAGKGWPNSPSVTSGTMEITYTDGGNTRTALVSGLKFAGRF